MACRAQSNREFINYINVEPQTGDAGIYITYFTVTVSNTGDRLEFSQLYYGFHQEEQETGCGNGDMLHLKHPKMQMKWSEPAS